MTKNNKLSLEQLQQMLSASAFNKTPYVVTMGVNRMLNGLLMYTHPDKTTSENVDNDIVFEAVPEFQRSNDKWSHEMQLKFVENVVKGHKTNIMIYEVIEADSIEPQEGCKLIDGLQRLTALYEFQEGRIQPFGYTYDELNKHRMLGIGSANVQISLYKFDSEAEAVQFYIDINENITHSKEDVDKAKTYLQKIINDFEL